MRSRKGYLLILAVLISGILFFLAIAYANLYSMEQKSARSAETDLVAAEAACAGIDAAIYQLELSSTWSAGFSSVSLPHSTGAYNVSFNTGQAAIPYSTNNSAGATSVAGYGGRTVPAGMVYIISIGTYGGSTKREDALVNMTGGITVVSRW